MKRPRKRRAPVSFTLTDWKTPLFSTRDLDLGTKVAERYFAHKPVIALLRYPDRTTVKSWRYGQEVSPGRWNGNDIA